MIDKLQDSPNSEALSWLLEMELVNSPYVLNSLILNMFRTIKGIKDVEFVIDERQKKLLIYLKLSWFYQRFKSKQVQESVNDMVEQILPAFKRRVVFDRAILEKSIDIMKNREKEYVKGTKRSDPPPQVNQDSGRKAGLSD